MDKCGVLVFLVGLLALAIPVLSQANGTLLCFTCNPTTHSAAVCGTPQSFLAPANCSAGLVGNISNFRFSCYSEFLNYNNASGNVGWNQTGVYRGCVVSTINMPHPNQCATALPVNVSRTTCSTCITSGCNTHTFTPGGGAAGGGAGGSGGGGGGAAGGGADGGASAIIPSTFISIICVFVTYIKSFY